MERAYQKYQLKMAKFEVSLKLKENLEYMYGKCCWRASPASFSIQIFIPFSKIQTVMKSHSLMPGASNLQFWHFRHAFSISGILKVAAHKLMKSRSRDGLAAKGLLQLDLDEEKKQTMQGYSEEKSLLAKMFIELVTISHERPGTKFLPPFFCNALKVQLHCTKLRI